MTDPFEIPGIVRVEKAKPYRTAMATEALLQNDRTATHYQVGKPDSFAKPIVLGEEMTFVEWHKPEDFVWRVYEWHLDERDDIEKWVPAGDFKTRDEAVNAAAFRAATIRQVES